MKNIRHISEKRINAGITTQVLLETSTKKMSKISHKSAHNSFTSIGVHQKYLSRITKTLYYGKLPKTDCLSLPVTELATDLFSEAQKGKSLERLHFNDAAKISRNACVSPCSLVLALLYLERLKTCNPEYLEKTGPSDLFLVSLMVSCKFLFDDGETDEVFMDEWAASGGVSVKELIELERNFLYAIDWKVFVNELTYFKKLKDIETSIASKEGYTRGYYTYTELETLATIIDIQNILQCLIAVSVILAATYTAGILTIFGSVFLASQVPGTSLYNKELMIENNHNLQLPFMEMNANETELELFDDETNVMRKVAVLDMLKTSIFLASIKTNANDSTTTICNSENNAQLITWDYWNIPIMNWLSKSSELISGYNNKIIDLPLKFYPYFPEISAVNMKHLELQEDHIQKATKTRIQDQMESSWHKEWTSSSCAAMDKIGFFFQRLVENVKS